MTLRTGDKVYLPDYSVYGLVIEYGYQMSKVAFLAEGMFYNIWMDNQDIIEIKEDSPVNDV